MAVQQGKDIRIQERFGVGDDRFNNGLDVRGERRRGSLERLSRWFTHHCLYAFPAVSPWHSAFPVIYCHVTNYLKSQWLKTTHIYYFIVPVGQESRCGLSWTPLAQGLSQASAEMVAGAVVI